MALTSEEGGAGGRLVYADDTSLLPTNSHNKHLHGSRVPMIMLNVLLLPHNDDVECAQR